MIQIYCLLLKEVFRKLCLGLSSNKKEDTTYEWPNPDG